MILFLFLCCITGAKIHLATVDSVDKNICTIQMEDGTVEILNSELCRYLKEGDKIKAERKNENR